MVTKCSVKRMRCLLKIETFVSLIIFGGSIYMFTLFAHHFVKNRFILAGIYGMLGYIFFLSACTAALYAVYIYLSLKERIAEESDDPLRFSSLLETHENNYQTIHGKDNLGHSYEEIRAESSNVQKHKTDEENIKNVESHDPEKFTSNSDDGNIETFSYEHCNDPSKIGTIFSKLEPETA